MRIKKSLFLIMTLLLLVVLAACGGNNDAKNNGGNDNNGDGNSSNVNEGFPIVDEELELDFFAKHPVQQSGVGNDWNDILVWNEYKDLTNIKINWDLIEEEGLEDRRNLSLHDKLPDAYFQAGFSMSDLVTYGQQGIFIELNDIIDEHMPNLSALMEEEPGIRKGITFPDGKIYSLPAVVDTDFLSVRLAARPWINEEHLDLVGMDMPETTDEFYEFLKAIKEEAPAGDNTIPYGGTAIAELEQWLAGSFGIMNRGQVNTNFDEDPDNPGQVRFYAASEGYKEMLEYINKLYSEGLIDQQILDNDWGHFTGLAGEESEAFSAYVFYEPVDFFGEEVGSKWTHMTALEGPNGDKAYNKVGPIVWDAANLVITSENPNPEATARWMDYFYSEEGQQLYYMGIEGETFEEDGGEENYVADLLNENGGPDEEAIMQHLTWVGAIHGVLAQDYFHGGESNAASVAASDDIEEFVPDVIWDRFTFDEDENEILSNQGTEINQYVEEMRDKFISGQESLDNFDKYVETLEKMGLEDVVNAYQAAFDRYQDN